MLFRAVSGAQRRQRTQRLLEFAALTEFTDRRGKLLSGGMKKKLALACTLIHRPKLLLLDEPTTGVDPVSRRDFWDILTELHLEGTTIVVSTPYMDEADRCSRVGLMFEGKLIACATPRTIRDSISGELLGLKADDWRLAKRPSWDWKGSRRSKPMERHCTSAWILLSVERRQSTLPCASMASAPTN